MLAIFHVEHAHGQVVAECDTYPTWRLLSRSFSESHRDAEDSLTDHIVTSLSFSHYDVPSLVNDDLRDTAA